MITEIQIKKLYEDSIIPKQAHEEDAAWDLYSAVKITIHPGQWAFVRTGVALAIPLGYAGLICPRSGLAKDRGITILNAPGVIDSGYRGEIGAILWNISKNRFYVEKAHRIAQLLIVKSERFKFNVTNGELSKTNRGDKGFGSTGGFSGFPKMEPSDDDLMKVSNRRW